MQPPTGHHTGLLAALGATRLPVPLPMPYRAVSPSRFEDRLRRSPVAALRDVVTKAPSSGPNLAALDGVRGIAVVLVIAGHADGLHLKGHGAVGVWLFFALSAFLLTLPYAADSARIFEPGRLWNYLRRRLLRILPAYFLAITVLAFLLSDPRFAWQHVLFIRASGIFWTIPQEMLFYLLLPPLLILHPLVFRNHYGVTILALMLMAALAYTPLTQGVFTLPGNDKRLPFHFGVFATGMAFAYAVHVDGVLRFVRRPAVHRCLDVLGLALMLSLVFTAPYYVERFSGLETRLGLHYNGVFGVLSGSLIAIAVVCEGGVTQRILACLPLRMLGLVSYSLYLFHVMVQGAVRSAIPGLAPGNALFLCDLVATFIVACVTYSLVERPLLRWGRP